MLNSFLFPAAVLCAASAVLAQGPVLGDPRPRLPAGTGDCTACVVADFDGDGRPDLARATDDRVAVLLQSVSGVFAPHATQPAAMLDFAGGIRSLAAGDFDGDGDQDLAVGMLASTDVLLVNDGTGRFARAPTGAIPSGGFVATLVLVAADFDRAGGDDLLVLPVNGPPRLLLQSGGAAFVDASVLLPSAASQPRTTATVADFDRDGAPDIVLGATALAPTLVLFNSGSGSFVQTLVPVAGATPIAALATADLDGDRAPELIAAPDSTATLPPVVARVTRQGATRVSPAPNSIALASWMAIAVGDIDHDGSADCIGLDGAGALWVGAGTGGGSFLGGVRWLDGGSHRRLCAVDLDGDLDLDLLVPGAALRDAILLGAPSGGLVATEDGTVPSSGGQTGARAAILDLSGEGDPDVLTCSATGHFVAWANDGGARFRPAPFAPPDVIGLGTILALLPCRLAAGGAPQDLFVVGQPGVASATGVTVLGRSAVTGWVDRSATLGGVQVGRIFSAAGIATLGVARPIEAPSDLLLGDVSGRVTIHRNDGTSLTELGNALPFVHLGSVEAILTGDVDGDGARDLVVLSANDGPQVHLARGNDRLQFVQQPGAAVTLAPAVAGVLEDLDGDGRLDLFCATPSSAEGVAFLRGLGNGMFVDVTAVELAALLPITGARCVAALGPATARRVMIGRQSADPLLLARRPNGAFLSAGTVAVGGSRVLHDLLVADLDADHDDDVVATRDDAPPAVLLRSDHQLASRGPAQEGKVVRLDVAVPAGQFGFVLFSPFTTRVPVANWGFLRLVSPATFTTVIGTATGASAIDLGVPQGLAGVTLPLQLVGFDPLSSTLTLGNLEMVEITGA